MSAKLNDRDLRRQALVLDDPRDQAGRVFEIGQGVGLLDILNVYRYSGYPQQKIHCAGCGGHHHARGFTALTSEGNRILLGSKCGAEAFGETWKSAAKRMNDRVARQYELHRLDRFELIFNPLRAALMTWTRPIEDLAWRRIGFSKVLGELYSRAREAAFRDDGQLVIYKKVMKRQASDSSFAAVPYARMRGADMFTGFERMNVVLVVEQAIKAIDEMTKGVHNTDLISMQAMRGRRVRMERLFEQLGEVAKAYEGGQEFFSDESFKILSEWSFVRDDRDYRYEFRRPFLRLVNGGGIAQKPPLPDLDGDILDLIQEYRRAD